jgi:hypothetical protein
MARRETMKTGYRYLAAAAAIGVIGAVFVAYARAYPVIMMFFTVFVLLPPFVVSFYIGVLELILGNRSGDGPGVARSLCLATLTPAVCIAWRRFPSFRRGPTTWRPEPRTSWAAPRTIVHVHSSNASSGGASRPV